jgi:hypothetical protein
MAEKFQARVQRLYESFGVVWLDAYGMKQTVRGFGSWRSAETWGKGNASLDMVTIHDEIDACDVCQDRKAIAAAGESYACRTHQKILDDRG